MNNVRKILQEQFELFRDRKRDESTEVLFEWINVQPKLMKKQCAKWRVWRIDNRIVSDQWKDYDRFQVYQDNETLLYNFVV